MATRLPKRKRPLIKPLVVGLLLVLIGLLAYWLWQEYRSSQSTGVQQLNENGVNLNPPTEQELEETEEFKESIGNNAQQPTTESGKKLVTPFITFADGHEINAYVDGVYEDGGTCTATLTKDSQTKTFQSTGFRNVSYTNCTPIIISPALEAGDWKIFVNYSSFTAEGKSDEKVITVN